MEKLIAWMTLAVIITAFLGVTLFVPGIFPRIFKNSRGKLEKYGKVLPLISLTCAICMAVVLAKTLIVSYVTYGHAAVMAACLMMELLCILSGRKTDELLMHLQMIESEVKRNEKK